MFFFLGGGDEKLVIYYIIYMVILGLVRLQILDKHTKMELCLFL